MFVLLTKFHLHQLQTTYYIYTAILTKERGLNKMQNFCLVGWTFRETDPKHLIMDGALSSQDTIHNKVVSLLKLYS